MMGPYTGFPSISAEVLVSAQRSGDNDMGDKTFTNNLISAEKKPVIYTQMQKSGIGENKLR